MIVGILFFLSLSTEIFGGISDSEEQQQQQNNSAITTNNTNDDEGIVPLITITTNNTNDDEGIVPLITTLFTSGTLLRTLQGVLTLTAIFPFTMSALEIMRAARFGKIDEEYADSLLDSARSKTVEGIYYLIVVLLIIIFLQMLSAYVPVH